MKEQLTAWLRSGGDYAAGLELFDTLARPVDLDRCQAYLHGGTDSVRRAMLEGELHRILLGLRDEPQLYGAEAPRQPSSKGKAEPDTTDSIGIHIAKYADLPAEQKSWYDRLKQIAPLIGSLHADLSRADLADDERKQTAQKLCRLDDERRKLWQQLDAWAEGQQQPKKQDSPAAPPQAAVTEVTAEEELQLLRRNKRLRDNIRAARNTIEQWQGTEGHEGDVARAQARLEKYSKELVEVKARQEAISKQKKGKES